MHKSQLTPIIELPDKAILWEDTRSSNRDPGKSLPYGLSR